MKDNACFCFCCCCRQQQQPAIYLVLCTAYTQQSSYVLFCLNDVYCYQKYDVVLCLYIKETVIWGGRFSRQWCRLICAQFFEALIFAIYIDRTYSTYGTLYVCILCSTTTKTLTPLTQNIFVKTLNQSRNELCVMSCKCQANVCVQIIFNLDFSFKHSLNSIISNYKLIILLTVTIRIEILALIRILLNKHTWFPNSISYLN